MPARRPREGTRLGRSAICWLRLYRQAGASPEFVSVLTEVPGNPGRSIANGHDHFTKYLEDEFQVDLSSLAVVHVWPAAFSDPPTWSTIDPHDGLVMADISRTHVEPPEHRTDDVYSSDEMSPIAPMCNGPRSRYSAARSYHSTMRV